MAQAHSVLNFVNEKDEKIQKLQDKLGVLNASSETKINYLKDSLKVAEYGKNAAEARAYELKRDLDQAKANLKKRKLEKDVIAEFRKSSTYFEELAEAAVAKIHRYWIIAEKHCKTDPNSSW